MTTPQERIKRDVVDELAWDSRVHATDVNVYVENVGTDLGAVTLSGTVPSHFSRLAAIDDAWRVSGVVEVIDQLGVRYPEISEIPTDERIRGNVESVLAWNPDIDISDVAVAVTGGVVTLEGTVNAFWRKLFAEKLILGLNGVVGVKNHLAIVPTEEVNDQVIAEDLVKALERRRCVEADSVNVTVEDGLVTLSGNVPSVMAEEAAFDAARYTQGVRGVRNDLNIAP
jgi:osmotically-inducible protein OsmY